MNYLANRSKTIFLFLGDIFVFYLALFLTLFVRRPVVPLKEIFLQHLYPFSLIFPLWLAVLYFCQLYDINPFQQRLKFFQRCLQAFAINLAIGIAFFYLVPSSINPKRNLVLVLAFSEILLYLWHNLFYLFIQASLLKRKIAFVGINQEVIEVIERLVQNPQLGYQVLFLLIPKENKTSLEKIKKHIVIYQGLSQLNQLLKEKKPDEVVVAMDPESHPVLSKELYHSSSNIAFTYFPAFYEAITQKIPLEMINRLWLGQKENKVPFYSLGKRLMDLILALIGGLLLFLFLPFLVISYLVTDGFPMFFSQTRVGKEGKKFRIWKLRTMIKGAERKKPLWAEENDTRVTPLGRFLRKYYIDELPQFINILKGEMSVVGPRPERPEFVRILQKEIPFYSLRHIVKPGVTGWAQINSFYARSVDDSIEKTKYDLYYIKNRSLLFDFDILLRTIRMVFSKRPKQNY